VFETTIRVLGGLLAAYDLTKDDMFKEKAQQLGERLLPAFSSPLGLPLSSIQLKSGHASAVGWTGGQLILAEIGTLQMEFAYLSKITGKKIYANKALHVFEVMNTKTKPHGLYPIYVDPNSGNMSPSSTVSLGAMGDSFYEYLLKVWLLTNKTQPLLKDMYYETTRHVIDKMVAKSPSLGLTYVGEYQGNHLVPRMDHLACFAAGMFGLSGVHSEDPKIAKQHIEIGEGIAETCYRMYSAQPSGISPEACSFAAGQELRPDRARYYILRPEALEAQFVMYRITHDPKYQDRAWEMFQAIEKHCRVENGYVGLADPTVADPPKDDHQQSFFLAETLKYLYLIFSPDDVVPLDKFVFNTEAHPLSLFQLDDLK
jgi:mannosyl-oligosaccharide alpha-1,2-mannosidase